MPDADLPRAARTLLAAWDANRARVGDLLVSEAVIAAVEGIRAAEEGAEMKTIYLVTSGEYSDYGIRAVFSTREAAQLYADEDAKAGGYGPYQVEEWPLDAEAGKVARPAWSAVVGLETGEIAFERADFTRLGQPRQRADEGITYPVCPACPEPRYTAFSFVSADHARKLAVEFRQKWLREGKPGPG